MGKAFGTGRQMAHDPTALGRQFRRRLATGDVLLGGCAFEMIRPSLVKLYKHAGFDFIYADNEHVLMAGLPTMADFVLAANDNGLPVIAKCPELGRTEVARLLEAGVTGIQLPRTESRQDLQTLIDYMKFTPVGDRAAAPIFGNTEYAWPDDIGDWMEKANESTIVVAHIETRRGLENIEEIVSTPGLDMLYLGALDFSISLGQPGHPEHPQVQQAMQRVLDVCLRHNVAWGTTSPSTEQAGAWMARGARFFETADELSMIAKCAAELVDDYNLAIKTVQTTYDYLRTNTVGENAP